jgi:hypothetical protein
MSEFRDLAFAMVERGIPVIPVQPQDKRCLLTGWQKKATTDREQILRWDAENPNFNVGCVGKPDGIVILDCDVVGLKKRIEQETGQKFPPTLVVKSGGKGAAHIYLLQNEWSRKLGNRQSPGLFDLQSVDKYVVGPGSTLGTGREYRTVDDSPLSEFPEWLYNWIVGQTLPEKSEPEPSTRDVEGELTETDLLDFLDARGVGYKQIKEGHWDVECPWEEEHTESSFGDTVVTFLGNKFGFGCKHAHCVGRNWHTFREAVDPDHSYKFPAPDPIDETELVEILESFNVDAENPAKNKPLPRSQKKAVCSECKATFVTGVLSVGTECPKCWEAMQADTAPEEDEEPELLPDTEDKSIVLVRGQRDGAIIEVRAIRASDIKDEVLEWLWPQRIPLGKVTWLAGKPDCGKSVVAVDIVARVSTGADFPDGRKNEWGPRKVLLGCTEDGLGDTVKPRLRAAGANLDNVLILDNDAIGVKKGTSGKQRMLKLSEDIKLLKAILKANPDIILVALDPITGYFGDVDTNKDKDIRPVMDKLIKTCDEMRVTFVAVMHVNKRSDVDAIHKILGASSVAGGARTAWGFSRDTEDDELCHMSRIKNNLSKDRTGLDYKLESKEVEVKGRTLEHPYIVWMGVNENTADDLMAKEREARRNGQENKKGDLATAFLRMKFSEKSQHKCATLYVEAEAEGISVSSLKRARTKLLGSGELTTMVDDRRAFGTGYWWIMPEQQSSMALAVGEVM